MDFLQSSRHATWARPYEDTGGTDAPAIRDAPTRTSDDMDSVRGSSYGSYDDDVGMAARSMLKSFRQAVPEPGKPSRMLAHQRDARLNEIQWTRQWNPIRDSYIVDESEHSPYDDDNVTGLDCWVYQDSSGGPKTALSTYKRLSAMPSRMPDHQRGLASPASTTRPAGPQTTERELASWLNRAGEYQPPAIVGSELRGTLRLVMCDRPNMSRGMTISRTAYEMVEAAFGLHPATLSFFFDNGGRYAMFKTRDENGKLTKIHIIAKATQKVEIANFTLSMTYDVASKSTKAFLCGDGVVLYRDFDDSYGHLERQILEAIANGGPELWTNPFLLPAVLLEVCVDRTLERIFTVESRLVDIENELGVTFAGWSGDRRDRSNWPMDIKVKWSTRELHSTLPQILFMGGVAAWQKRYADWLLATLEELRCEDSLIEQRSNFETLQSSVGGFLSSVEGSVEFFDTLKGRAQSQIDLLFSVIGQRDSLISQKANDLNFEVARSTKEDSISMSTFTFITAVFLPPSFIATLFSMSMFDWSNGSGDDSSSDTVSNKFWIFWVVATPLTAIVIAGWYWWYKHADAKWMKRLVQVQKSAGTLNDPENKEDIMRRKEHENTLREKERLERLAKEKAQAAEKEEKPYSSWSARMRKIEGHFHPA